ncbi:MAG: hypothetical protein QOD60_225 [Solirubrobacterales bacterium]|jgi:hypothetical protein|nr:hypothetical protein [Solirubrobacterales bacterium]
MKTRIAIIAITAAGLLLAEQGAATAAPTIPTPRQLATTACKAQRSTLGAKVFRKRNGAHPMRGCLRKQVAVARQDLAASAAECDDEIATDGMTVFIDTWSDDDGTGAWENCVIDGVVPTIDDSADVPVDDTTL